MTKLIEQQFHTYYLSILAHLKPNTGKKQSMILLSQKQPFTTSGVLNYGETKNLSLTCQLTRLERFSTTSLYSVLVGGPYL